MNSQVVMFSADKSLPPPPSASRPRNESLGATLPTYRNRPSGASGASDLFSSAKSVFETLNKPEVRSGIVNFAKNPLVQKTAVTVAKNEQARAAAISASQNPTVRNFALTSAFGESSAKQIAKQFESKPIMGFAPQPTTHKPFTPMPFEELKTNFVNNPPKQGNMSAIYPSLSAIDPFDFPPQLPPSPTKTNDRSSKPMWATSQFSTSFASKKPAPNRPPPPKIGSNSNPNLVSLAPSSPDHTTNEPHATVKYPYKAANYDELSCDPNDTVILKREVDGQWIFATNTRTGESGIVPLSFLNIKVPLVPTSRNSGGLSFSVSDYNCFGQNQCTARALYAYDTGVDGDLRFNQDDTILIIARVSDEWVRGEIQGRRGIFPMSYVTILGDLDKPFASRMHALSLLFTTINPVSMVTWNFMQEM
ncbi:SH3 domain-containing protein [Ditylenchus destructor]|nr:SH3 domain-containing protein [Ditylenchus destructor]